MLRTLEGYLARMGAIVDDAWRHLAGGAPGGTADLMRLRGEQAHLLASYQLFVHREVFEPLIRGGDAGDAARARSLKIECIALAEDFRHYTRAWAERDVAADWDAYRPAAMAMVDRVRDHIDNVRELIATFAVDRAPSGLIPALPPRELMAA